MDPSALPKGRGSQPRPEPLRITPVRKSSITPDAWGIHSVPGMLTDFQRHTSQSMSPAVEKRGALFEDAGQPRARLAAAFMLLALAGVAAATSAALAVFPRAAPGIAGVYTLVSLATPTFKWESVDDALRLIDAAGACAPACFVAALAALGPGWAPYVAALAAVDVPDRAGARAWVWLAAAAAVPALITRQPAALPWLAGAVLPQLNWPAIAQKLGSPRGMRIPRRTRTIVTAVLGAGLMLAALRERQPTTVHGLALLGGVSFAAFRALRAAVKLGRFDAPVVYALTALPGFAHVELARTAAQALLLAPALWLEPSELPATLASSTESAQTVLGSILVHEDTRNIFYFFALNFSFMFVQLLYSLLTHSLVLLSDTIHMFFDCLSLLVGLVASILSKMPPSARFPYGVAMVETVSGFANGCLLLAISVGILFESFERVVNPVPLERTTELLIVSTLGLLVNLVGLFVFGHHGHSHGGAHEAPVSSLPAYDCDCDATLVADPFLDIPRLRPPNRDAGEHEPVYKLGDALASSIQDDVAPLARSREHEHAHAHSHAPAPAPAHEHSHSHAQSHEHSHSHSHSHGHEHGHEHEDAACGGDGQNENIYGIFLHILADVLGSVGAIVSTLLTFWVNWAGFDALASMVTSALIFVSALPLVRSSSKFLLLGLKDDEEYKLRTAMSDIYNLPGVIGYATPKFWDDGRAIRGLIHVQYARTADMDALRQQVARLLVASGVRDPFIQMDLEGSDCWCLHESQQ